MFSYAVDHCFKYSDHLYLGRVGLLCLFISLLPGCTSMAMSEEPSSPLRLLNSELGMSQTQVNRPLLRRHRKSMRCADNNGQNCVFKSTKTLPISLAGRLITEIHYRFEDGQLQQIIGYFGSHKKSDGFEERMRQYYGKPSQSSPNQLRWKQGMEQLTLDADSIRLEKINAQ